MKPSLRVEALLLAAGAGTRLGGNKLDLPFRGKPLMMHALEALLACSSIDRVTVVVRPGTEVRCSSPRCQVLVNPEPEHGQAGSLVLGLAALAPSCRSVVLSLADLPLTSPGLISELLTLHRQSNRAALRPVYRGRPGHPVIVAHTLLPSLLTLEGDEGCKGFFSRHPEVVELVEVEDPAVVRDVDTPADLRELCGHA